MSILTDFNENSENFWTRDPSKIINKMDNLSTNFLIYYTKGNETVPHILLNDFDVLATLNWGRYLNTPFFSSLKWHFLKRSTNSKQLII